MDDHKVYARIHSTHSAAAREYARAAQDEQNSCYADLMQIGASATKQWRTACEAYMQELRASAAGDDALQRASAAYRNLQREYDKIQADYMKACEERYSRMGSELTAQSASARNKLLDTWIEGLNELRRTTASSPAAASAKKGAAQ
jgi:hypothetical protein